jgi:site-specific recombinase XerD
MAIRHQLKHSINNILKHNRDGSFETQAAREHILLQAANDLVNANYKLRNVHGLKQKHVISLNQSWQTQGISIATIKNRNSHLRWLCEKLNKSNLMPTNDQLGTGKRTYVTNVNKAIELKDIDLTKITNRHIYVSIHLQYYLGLRREECLKIKPHQADKGDHIFLQPSWCKGKRSRTVPILTPEARHWLNEAKKLATNPDQSLIPNDKNYKTHRDLYDKQTQRAGIKHAHGLRHAYAQNRYKELTGWECPKRGGPASKELTKQQKEIDRAARLKISADLGHSREAVTTVYLGR